MFDEDAPIFYGYWINYMKILLIFDVIVMLQIKYQPCNIVIISKYVCRAVRAAHGKWTSCTNHASCACVDLKICFIFYSRCQFQKVFYLILLPCQGFILTFSTWANVTFFCFSATSYVGLGLLKHGWHLNLLNLVGCGPLRSRARHQDVLMQILVYSNDLSLLESLK